MPVQDAIQDMFCQAVKLGGMLMGDNKRDTLRTTAAEVTTMVDAARKVGRCAQILLIMRGEQAQSEVLRRISDGGSDDEDLSEDEEIVEQRNAVTDSHAEDVLAVPLSVLHLSTRGVRVPLESLCRLSGLSDLNHVLELDVSEAVTIAKTLKFEAQFEWGSASRIQFLRATTSFHSTPWFDHVRYQGDNGEVR
ncbi:hypothetical protein I4F81_006307 [Pyropia yezoensis]|uniref:Uncharacterized protein n=1 Tax=Pyropia yezoensis TaxID=2788 RepID=A0ACC3C0X4_PYRYE|nr:hypothetical protein I4F81_006307 [Neopyropia yezoensis]